jgi:hypothetical protein
LNPICSPSRVEQRDGTLAPCFAGIDDRQALWVLLGIAVCSTILFVPWDDLLRRYQRTSLIDWLDHYRYAWLTIGVALILATFLFGVDPNNSGVRALVQLRLLPVPAVRTFEDHSGHFSGIIPE